MFEYRYNNGTWKLHPANHVVFALKDKFSAKGMLLTIFVDIVHADYFQQYLDNQVQDINLLYEYIGKNPKVEPISVLLLDT
jgi:hypothetical protein